MRRSVLAATLVALAGGMVSTAMGAYGDVEVADHILVSATATSAAPASDLMLTPPAEEFVGDTVDAIQPILDQYPSLDAGLHWNSATGHLEVGLVPPGKMLADPRPTVEEAVQGAVDTLIHKVAIEFVDGLVPRRDLEDLAHQVMDTRAQWAKQDASSIVRVIPDRSLGKIVVVATPDTLASVKVTADNAYGTRVIVEAGSRPSAVSRYFDTSPWSAGIPLWFDPAGKVGYPTAGTADCTNGWTWNHGGVLHASTAGHCRAVNGNVWHSDASQRIGYVSNRWYSDGGSTDFELIRITSGAVDATVYVGTRVGATLRTVRDADNSATATGFTVCANGANGGNQCGVVTDTGVLSTYTAPSGLEIQMQDTTCVDMTGDAYVYHGDSGGPVLTTYAADGSVTAYGQVVFAYTFPNTDPCGFGFTPVVTISAVTSSTLLVN